jgi:hypothetical protein
VLGVLSAITGCDRRSCFSVTSPGMVKVKPAALAFFTFHPDLCRRGAAPASWRYSGRGPCHRTCGWYLNRPAQRIRRSYPGGRINTNAGIGDRELPLCLSLLLFQYLGVNVDHTLLSEFDGIADQVDQDLPKRVGSPFKPGAFSGAIVWSSRPFSSALNCMIV